jgi:hypothetical protein
MGLTPRWRVIESRAEEVNRTPAVDGEYRWMCEVCSKEWTCPVDEDGYDRTKDRSNWPVLCVECSGETYGKAA